MKDKLLRLILTFILVISIILAVVAYHAVRNVNRSSEARDWVNHTYTVLRAIEQLQTFHYVAEAGAQVYVATDATPNRDQSNEAIVMISEQIAIIKALTRNAPDQVEQVNAIEMRSNQLVSTLQQILKAQRNGDFAKAQSLLHDHTGSIDSADLDRKIDALHEIQLQLLTDRDKESYLQDQAMRWTVWNGIILYVLLMAGVILLTRNHLKARTQAAESLKAAHDSLEERVKERTIELEESNRALSLENLERQWTNQSLEHQLHYNHHIVDAVGDLVVVLTKTGQITRVNPAVLHLTGWESTDLIKHPFNVVIQTDDDPETSHDLEHSAVLVAMKEGRDLRKKPASVINQNGQRIPVTMSMYPLRDGNKIIGGIITLNQASQA